MNMKDIFELLKIIIITILMVIIIMLLFVLGRYLLYFCEWLWNVLWVL